MQSSSNLTYPDSLSLLFLIQKHAKPRDRIRRMAGIRQKQWRKGHLRAFLWRQGWKWEELVSRLRHCRTCKSNSHVTVFHAFKVVHGELDKLPEGSVFVHVDVGGRTYWKNKENDFRVDPKLKLSGVPTLLKYGEKVRFIGFSSSDVTNYRTSWSKTNFSSLTSFACCLRKNKLSDSSIHKILYSIANPLYCGTINLHWNSAIHHFK